MSSHVEFLFHFFAFSSLFRQLSAVSCTRETNTTGFKVQRRLRKKKKKKKGETANNSALYDVLLRKSLVFLFLALSRLFIYKYSNTKELLMYVEKRWRGAQQQKKKSEGLKAVV